MKIIAFITRVKPRRFKMLMVCTNSIKRQTSDDYIHIIHQTIDYESRRIILVIAHGQVENLFIQGFAHVRYESVGRQGDNPDIDEADEGCRQRHKKQQRHGRQEQLPGIRYNNFVHYVS